MSKIESTYDVFVEYLKRHAAKVDPNLLLKTMYLERKFPGFDPHVDLEINFKQGTDITRKQFQAQTKFGLATGGHGKNGIVAAGRMGVKGIIELASSDSVESIAGNATASLL